MAANGLSSTELYDPATWDVDGDRHLSTARDAHTATLLPSGKVLVAGGPPLEAVRSCMIRVLALILAGNPYSLWSHP